MSHKLEGVLSLARTYQLPLWTYSPHAELNPYLLASVGFRPVARGVLQCHICLRRIELTEELQSAPASILERIKQHEEHCIYANEQPMLVGKEELYLAMDDITAEMDLSKGTLTSYPLLDRKAILAFVGANAFLLRKVLALYEMSMQNFKITFLLKMFGWYLAKQEGKDCLNCYFCGRSLHLDRFRTIPEDKQADEQAAKKQEDGLFNPVGQHRYFCLMAGKEQYWLLFLQHQQDKFAQTCSFKFKTAPLESQRMRLHIDKYIETAKEKIQSGLAKLRTITHQCGLLCSQMGEDKNLGIEEEHEGDLKRFRDHEHNLQMMGEVIGRELNHPLKKIRFN